MLGGFLGGLANLGGIVRGADEAADASIMRQLHSLQVQNMQQQQTNQAGLAPLLTSGKLNALLGGGLGGMGQQPAPQPGMTPPPAPQGPPPYAPGQVAQTPLELPQPQFYGSPQPQQIPGGLPGTGGAPSADWAGFPPPQQQTADAGGGATDMFRPMPGRAQPSYGNVVLGPQRQVGDVPFERQVYGGLPGGQAPGAPIAAQTAAGVTTGQPAPGPPAGMRFANYPGGPDVTPPQSLQQTLAQAGPYQDARTRGAFPTQTGGGGTVRGSVYGNYGEWRDPSDRGLQAGGQPVSAGPGIALPIQRNSPDFGKFYDVTAPNGTTLRLQQTDVGPGAPGRGVDINAVAAERFGYKPHTFPTDGNFRVAPIDGNRAFGDAHAGVNNTLAQESTPQDRQNTTRLTPRLLTPQILAMRGSLDLDQLGQFVDSNCPGCTPATKVGVFQQAVELLHPIAKERYTALAEAMKFDIGQEEKGREFDIRQKELGEYRRARLGQEKAGESQGQLIQDEEGNWWRLPTHAGRPAERVEGAPKGGYRPGTKKAGVGEVDAQTVDSVARNIGEYRQAPMSGWAMNKPFGQAVMAKVREFFPDYSAPKYAATVSASRAWETGRQADALRFIDVSMDHLKTVDQLGEALDTGDNRTINRLRNAINREFGYEQVPDFEAAKMVVADEVIKAVVGGVATGGDRERLQQQLDAANSPEQLKGVTTQLRRLIAGQLGGMKRQYLSGTKQSEESFDERLSPDSRAALSQNAPQPGGTAPAPGSSGRTRHEVGATITIEGKRYRVTGGDPYDPDIEEIK